MIINMRLIVKDRKHNKITQLIYTSQATGYPIVTINHKDVDHIKEMAKILNCDVPEPVLYCDLSDVQEEKQYEALLMDYSNVLLNKALSDYFNCNIECFIE